MENHALSVPFAIESVSEEKRADGTTVGRFTGLASTFGNVDQVGDIIAPGAFRDSIGDPRKIKMLWQHDPAEGPIGVWDRLSETDAGLAVEGRLLLDVPRGAQAHSLMKARALDSMSIGFKVGKNGADFDKTTGNRILRKIDLWEISVVTFPANPKAKIGAVKSMPSPREMEAALHDLGLSRAQAKGLLSRGYAGLGPEAEELEATHALIASIRAAMQ